MHNDLNTLERVYGFVTTLMKLYFLCKTLFPTCYDFEKIANNRTPA